jgi:RNA-directed DNA polymerase
VSFSRESYLREAQAQERSPAFIAKSLEYADALSAKNLPVIFSVHHLSLLLDIPLVKLKWIMEGRAEHYKYYPIKKRRGGTRMISSPFSNLKEIQRWINEKILSNVNISESATGFKKNCSIKQNAIPHERKNYIFNLDLLKFFDSIPEFKVYQVFADLGYAKNVAIDLARLTTVPLHKNYYKTFNPADKKIFQKYFDKEIGVLPQGAPTSPMLSNIILRNLDKKMESLAIQKECRYTRYADDITISHDSREKLPSKKELISIIKSEGVFVNFGKMRVYGKGQKQMVTGLTIADGVHVPKAYRKDIYRHLYFCLKFSPDDHLKKIRQGDKNFFREWLIGRINFVYAIDKKIAEDMFEKLNRINWPL